MIPEKSNKINNEWKKQSINQTDKQINRKII